MSTKLDKLELKLRGILSNAAIKQVYIKKAKKHFLCVMFNRSVRIFDEDGSIYVATGRLDYRANNNDCYIGDFEVNENFQSLGIGRYLYDLALAHADVLGATKGYGYINPVNNIKGVSVPGENCREKEIEFLKNVYKNLGNAITILNEGERVMFVSKWNSGDRVKLLNDEQYDVLNDFFVEEYGETIKK